MWSTISKKYVLGMLRMPYASQTLPRCFPAASQMPSDASDVSHMPPKCPTDIIALKNMQLYTLMHVVARFFIEIVCEITCCSTGLIAAHLIGKAGICTPEFAQIGPCVKIDAYPPSCIVSLDFFMCCTGERLRQLWITAINRSPH